MGGGEVYGRIALLILNLGASWGWCEFHDLVPLFSGKDLVTNCTGGWVGPWTGLDR